MCFYGQTTDKETHKCNFFILLITPFGPTRIVCVNFSSIGSFVFQIFEKKRLFVFFYAQTDRETDIFGKKKLHRPPLLFVNFSSIGSLVFELVKMAFLGVFLQTTRKIGISFIRDTFSRWLLFSFFFQGYHFRFT